MDLTRMHTAGNLELLALRQVAFFCSRNAPAETWQNALAWAAVAREAGTCVISGFHSGIEKEVLRQLLPGSQPLIVILARGLKGTMEPELAEPLAKGRLLVMTRYAESVTHACEESCHQRNRLMMELAAEAVVGFASPGGKLERLLREFSGTKPIHFLSPHPSHAAGDPVL